jgi:hypothetical protein
VKANALELGLVVAIAVAACGVRSLPRPPEDTAPRAPDTPKVRVTDESVRLRWERPSRAVDGEPLYDLAGFIVERRVGGAEFTEIHQMVVDDNERIRPQQNFTFDDESPPPGRLFYRVRAFTLDGQRGAASPPVLVGEDERN